MQSSYNSELAPIVVFVFNRPEHTRKTIESLQKNLLAESSDLIIYSDAPRSERDYENVTKVRSFINIIDGFRSVKIVERATNYGLAKSIIDGVTEICNCYGKVIVMEDDLDTSPYFLKYMNQALDKYAESENVMHVSGCSYPIEPIEMQDTYFLQVPLCWGWATWNRAWKHFDNKLDVIQSFSNEDIFKFNFDNTYNYWMQLELNRDNKIKTWFIFWYATIYKLNALCLFPSNSLVRNIGFDNSGVNCDETDDYDVMLTTHPVKIQDIPLEVMDLAYQRHVEYFKSIKPTFTKKLVSRLRRLQKIICGLV